MIMKKVQQEEETGGRKVLLSMCLDEMSLRKFIVFSTKLEDAVEVCRSEYDLVSEVEGQDWIDEYIVSSIQRTEYKDDCLVYIAGYIQKTHQEGEV